MRAFGPGSFRVGCNVLHDGREEEIGGDSGKVFAGSRLLRRGARGYRRGHSGDCMADIEAANVRVGPRPRRKKRRTRQGGQKLTRPCPKSR